LRPPQIIDPATGRRGSMPETAFHRRPVPSAPPSVPPTMPRSHTGAAHGRRSILPRLTTNQVVPPTPGPLTAPPRANTGRQQRPQTRPDTRQSTREKQLKKIGCVVM
jgi:hypothetical protein